MIQKEVIDKVIQEMSLRGMIDRIMSKEQESSMEFYLGMVYGAGYDEGRKYQSRRNWKKIGQYDDEGNLIKVFASATIAAKAVNGHRDNITRAARGGRVRANGYKWKYV